MQHHLQANGAPVAKRRFQQGLLKKENGHYYSFFYRVAEASNGREAIQQFRAHHPDVTLMDLQMPEMNGLDAMIAIRGEFPEVCFILLTTYAGDVQVLRALKTGARGCLLKIACTRNC